MPAFAIGIYEISFDEYDHFVKVLNVKGPMMAAGVELLGQSDPLLVREKLTLVKLIVSNVARYGLVKKPHPWLSFLPTDKPG
ncbi:MAG: hypothetical protein OQL06_01590 [Gammaproteobacteria bacterium]|nr:hypothetical protein [Gammaproteobacteria bacterium]